MFKTLGNVEARKQQILHGNIVKTLLMLSFPTMMYGVVQAIVPLVDSFFINNYIGRIAGSAVAYSSSFVLMFNALALGIGVAGSALIGQNNGRGESQEAKRISLHMLVLVAFLGILMMPVLYGLALFMRTRVEASISQDVFTYMSLSCFILPLSYVEAAYNANKNTNGEPEKPFIRMALLMVLKLLFNVIFIRFLNWGIFGAVASTFTANILILIWMMYEMFLSPKGSRYSIRAYRPDNGVILRLLRLGVPSMLNNFVLYLGFFLITDHIEQYGTAVLNGQGIATNIVLICYTVPQAFSMGVTTMVSMNIGAGNAANAQKCCLAGNCASILTAALLAAAVIPSADFLANVFTTDPEVAKVIVEYLNICTFAVPAFGVLMVNIGAFNGLGRTSVALLIGILRIWVFRYAFMLVTESFLGYYALFWGDFFSNYICAALTLLLVFKLQWRSAIK